ncbi:Beta-fructofuranosidase, insoluble isoenzyme 2 [Triticum urartu]|uniref:Beta-fructofuranosidase, insoluble isoenzyme 2 n=1 Tax=Triticum urartu TaxID=4572 RepID=M7ZK60_TRIUA|nr:Beta-fructofuranosidase, insoluble isoenzyme 2 [Triticum urartu]
MYTGDKQKTQDLYHEVQNIAFPKNKSDPLLREWVKPGSNPIIVPEGGINDTKFRDPTTAWHADGHWSRDFKRWTRVRKPLHSAATGMWECPDFYPVAVDGWQYGLDTSVPSSKHVLKNSLEVGRERYVPDDPASDEHHLRYDYGNFYASKTFYDPAKRRRILWGWANESDTDADDVAKGWAGIQADVEVSFEVPSLEGVEALDPALANDAQKLCSVRGADVEGGVGPFGLWVLASSKLEERTAIFFRVFKAAHNINSTKLVVLMCSDPTMSSLSQNLYKPTFAGFVDTDITKGKISLRSLIDGSVVESFGAGGRTCILSRVYPTLARGDEARLHVFNNGKADIKVSQLTAWAMKPAFMNGA